MIIKVWNSKNYCIYTNPKSVGFQVCFLQPHSLELQQITTLYLITTKPTDYHSDNTCSHTTIHKLKDLDSFFTQKLNSLINSAHRHA